MTDDAKHDLLIAGARDFLKASIAIREFGQQVFGIASRALGQRENELQQALGFPITRNQAQIHPSKGYIPISFDGTLAVLGLSVQFTKDRWFCLYVLWRMSEGYLVEEKRSAVALFELYTVRAAERLAAAVRGPSAAAVQQEQYEVWVEKFLPPDEFVNLESHFLNLIDQWLSYGEAVGGLEKYMK